MQAQFQGQTKSKLNNPEISPIVESAGKALEQLLNEKPTVAEAIVNRVILAAKARAASRAAVKSVTRKIGISHRLTLPGKLADCSSIRPDQSELFIVEGDSAGGSTKQGRDRHYQAVLPIRGKVLNTIAASSKQVLENKELSNIIAALGCGVGDDFRLDKLRYGKVIILTDADADGMHIATLLMAFFFVYLRGLLEGGCLFLGRPPLYGIFPKGRRITSADVNKKRNGTVSGREATTRKRKKGSSGDQAYWAYSDEELQQLISSNNLSSAKVARYKGLGEMNPDTLWATTLDPDTRTLLRVRIEDHAIAMKALQALMGNDPSKRFELIQQHAAQLELDV